jgi:hypothetical protein
MILQVTLFIETYAVSIGVQFSSRRLLTYSTWQARHTNYARERSVEALCAAPYYVTGKDLPLSEKQDFSESSSLLL